MGQGRVRRLLAWPLALAALFAGCATLEAQQKRLAADPLFGGGAKKSGAASPTPTPAPKATAAAATAKPTPGPIEKARAAIDAISDEDERALGERRFKDPHSVDAKGVWHYRDATAPGRWEAARNFAKDEGLRVSPPKPAASPSQPTATPAP